MAKKRRKTGFEIVLSPDAIEDLLGGAGLSSVTRFRKPSRDTFVISQPR